MVNPWAGELELTLDGERRTLKLTLGALAELEERLREDDLVSLIERFEAGRYSTRDVLELVVAGLRGGGWEGRAEDLLSVEIEGGPIAAAAAAGQLLVRAFAISPNGNGM